ncbi:hypothetical protein [Sporosarcina globispora]|uniref:hypothetical protein n=1 Tax=Sporosarcina globispora TaxID=1459 RepID=UPI000A5944DD|nr:hypothetical protein [Sporosarcina globispora]
MYRCYLNGKFYGTGNLKYMQELFVDYVVTCEMYGKNQAEFKIIKLWNEGEEPIGTTDV